MRSEEGQGRGVLWLEYSVWTIALWASFLNLLNFGRYPLFRPEVGITLLGLALVGVLMSAIHRLAKPRLSFLFAALFAGVAIDLNSAMNPGTVVALCAGLAIVFFFAERAGLTITLAAFTAVLVFQLVALVASYGEPPPHENEAQNRQAARESSSRPPIVHLVLDSYLGLDGMALGPANYRDLRAEHVAFLRKYGFQYYPRAYSRHTRTIESLPTLFSYGGKTPAVKWVSTRHAVPGELAYFRDLDRSGYRIDAVVPKFFDLCVNQKMTSCRSWENSRLTSMLGTQLGTWDRAKIFAFTLVRLSAALSKVAAALQFRANDWLGTDTRWPFDRSQLVHLASLKELDGFVDDLADLRPGEVRFAHFLIPHSPYGLTSKCEAKPEAEWMNEHGPSSEAKREQGYVDQVRCLQRRLGKLMDELEKTEAGRQAIVLIHGDHGSRIAPGHPFLGGPELSERQQVMLYSTLFAIRVPGEAPGQVPGTYALDELLANFRDRGFGAAPRPKEAPARVRIIKGRELLPLRGFRT
jgi:hypothetical protein